MRWKHLPTVAIAIGLGIVIFFAVSANLEGNPHGSDREAWIKDHGETVKRNQNPDEFCLDCHREQLGHTMENFCVPCHQASGVEWNGQ